MFCPKVFYPVNDVQFFALKKHSIGAYREISKNN